jgi:hypothetical protein
LASRARIPSGGKYDTVPHTFSVDLAARGRASPKSAS